MTKQERAKRIYRHPSDGQLWVRIDGGDDMLAQGLLRSSAPLEADQIEAMRMFCLLVPAIYNCISNLDTSEDDPFLTRDLGRLRTPASAGSMSLNDIARELKGTNLLTVRTGKKNEDEPIHVDADERLIHRVQDRLRSAPHMPIGEPVEYHAIVIVGVLLEYVREQAEEITGTE